jgi:hypothetical protein
METLRPAGFAIAAMLSLCGGAAAGDYDWEDIWAPYTERVDRMTSNSGNAQEVNSATHTITPWPPRVRDRRIPGNGARMVGAIQRYRDPRSLSGGAPSGPIPSSAPPTNATNTDGTGAPEASTDGGGGSSANSGQ